MQYKLSAFADEISDNFETQLKVLKSFNIGYIEARCIENVQLIEYSTQDIKEFKNILDGYGIKLSSLASPIGKISIRGDLRTHYEKLKRTVEIAEILEAPYIRMFSFYIDRDTIPGEFKGKVLDELNKYAPKGSENARTLTRDLLEITERGRSLGVILFGAEQFRSGVHDRVLGNCSTNVYGRTSPIEISKCPDYHYFPPTHKSAIARLPKGSLLLQHAVFKTPLIKVHFPFPAYNQPKVK
jgi:sugar phosphate isomerase/epimerase